MITTIPDSYDAWAPVEGCWSPWVKPVLFTYPPTYASAEMSLMDVGATVAAAGTPDGITALVLDLPYASALVGGLALAPRGWRPVPLYNGVSHGLVGRPLVQTGDIINALHAGGEPLRACALPADAPPVFLLDSLRLTGRPAPLVFDNRWVVTPQDLPSAERLRHHGITRVRFFGDTVLPDLGAVLGRWRTGGLTLERVSDVVVPLVLPTLPWWIGTWAERVAVRWGLKRSSAGGFGGLVPEPSKGGHG